MTRGVREAELVPSRPGTLRGVPINQEDLLGTLGTFTVTTFEVMEKLGVPWNDEAELAYLMLWDRVGELLGIGTRAVWNAAAQTAQGRWVSRAAASAVGRRGPGAPGPDP